MAGWNKGEVIGVIGIAVALLGVGAALVVPELRSAAGLSPEPSSGRKHDVEQLPSAGGEVVFDKAEPTTSSPPRIHAVTASSVHRQMGKVTYVPEHLVDGLSQTAWVEGVDGPGYGESVTLQLGAQTKVHRLRIDNGYARSPKTFATNNRVASLEVRHAMGLERFELSDTPSTQVLTLREPVSTQWLKLTIVSVYFAPDSIDTAITEVGVE